MEFPPLKSKGGPDPSASAPVESGAGEATWKPSLSPSEEKQKQTSLRVQEDLGKATCLRKCLFDTDTRSVFDNTPKKRGDFFPLCLCFYFFSLVIQCKVCSHMIL